MFMQTPVLACNSGGPLESIKNGESGYLLSQKSEDWCDKMEILSQNPQLAKQIGDFGKKHVESIFGLDAFSNQANNCLKNIGAINKKNK